MYPSRAKGGFCYRCLVCSSLLAPLKAGLLILGRMRECREIQIAALWGENISLFRISGLTLCSYLYDVILIKNLISQKMQTKSRFHQKDHHENLDKYLRNLIY